MVVASLSLLAGSAAASPTAPRSGAEYTTLAKPQATDSGKKVEVIEFFGYFCHHCYAIDPALNKWVAAQGDKIAFKRVHVLFDPRMASMQRAYVTLDMMKNAEAVHGKIFEGMHKFKLRLDKPDLMTLFLTKVGIDQKKYLDMYKSFSVQTRMRRNEQLLNAYAIESVPQIVVDGRYVTSPDHLRKSLGGKPGTEELHAATMQVLDALVAKAAKARAGAK
ncbi:thiol:disulfide interchange protein DsbA/DsbL [Massilia glaciei]|nr:thiol:disulfide interchange protein DsbA/DsbL [Massilia glaciei]